MYIHMYVKKAAKMTFILKMRAKNVDEIDGRFASLIHNYLNFIFVYLFELQTKKQFRAKKSCKNVQEMIIS